MCSLGHSCELSEGFVHHNSQVSLRSDRAWVGIHKIQDGAGVEANHKGRYQGADGISGNARSPPLPTQRMKMTERRLGVWSRAQGIQIIGTLPDMPTTGVGDRSQLPLVGMFSLAEDAGIHGSPETWASARAATAP